MLIPVLAGRMVTVSNGPGRFGQLTFTGYQIGACKLLALFGGSMALPMLLNSPNPAPSPFLCPCPQEQVSEDHTSESRMNAGRLA